MVKQAELRSILTDLNKVQTSVNAFRVKYNALPGDMVNATAYWGTATTCPATTAAPLNTQATCNGNGNGLLATGEGGVTSPEWWLFWEHLVNAGLGEGSYTGASVTATTQARPGTNVPVTKISGVGLTAFTLAMPVTDNAAWWFGNYTLLISVGSEQADTAATTPAFSPLEASSMDTKLDDGRPGTGIFRTLKNVTCVQGLTAANATTISQSAAVYDLTQLNQVCTVLYNIAGNPGTGN